MIDPTSQIAKDCTRLTAVRERVINTIEKLLDIEELNDFQETYLSRLLNRKITLERQIVQKVFEGAATIH